MEMPPPTKGDWIQIEERFHTRWNFPNCTGALDGKHIVIQAPNKSGSLFFNYKGTYSIVLMALVDPDYHFTYVDIGNYGSNADGSIFKHSNFGQAFMNGQLNIPDPKPLPNYPEGGVLPYCIVADKAFPLRMDLMRPFPRGGRMQMPNDERIFNYRLSRACHIVENTFGIPAQRWRAFQRRLCLKASNVDKVVKA